MINPVSPMARPKLHWQRVKKRYWLTGHMVTVDGQLSVANELQLAEVQAWCKLNNCGKRMSFSEFRFRNEQELSLFFLRWA